MTFFKATLLSMIFLAMIALQGDPWGKDSDIAHSREIHSPRSNRHPLPSRCETAVAGPIAELLIAFHQNVISPADGPRSHFLPSSSQYTLEAMRKYGFFSGFLLGCDRLMRENDEAWVYKKGRNSAGETMKLNPVP